MGYKLLLADDSITIQKVVELVLAGEGFDIKATNNGDEALAAIPAFRPDVVLADIAMPVMNGYQLCERIKRNPDTKDIPVIMLAGAFEPIDEELAKNVGADDYIVKPFESQELISKVNAFVAGKGIAEEAPVDVEQAEVLAAAAEEDLWTMEEFATEPGAQDELIAETLLEEEAVLEEELEPAEELVAEVEPEREVVGEQIFEEPVPRPAPVAAAAATAVQVEVPSKEEFASMIRETIDEKVSSMVSGIDVQDVLLASITPSVKDSAEKVLWEVAPQLIENLLREMLQGVLASLSKEVEKVIWETVPELAETMISKEIAKIRSEMG